MVVVVASAVVVVALTVVESACFTAAIVLAVAGVSLSANADID